MTGVMAGVGAATAASPAGGRLVTRGHDRATQAIAVMIAGHPPHALLIGGLAGVGKTTLALDLAAGLLCDAAEPTSRPCRECRACRLVDRGIHPDLHRIAPTGPSGQIRIGDRDRPDPGTIRRLSADLVLLPVEGGPRVAIVEQADRMTEDAQTALLKTLEEPPAGVTIVLCADDEERLLPTVRSRCQRIRLGPVSVRDVEAILGEMAVADPPTAARLARLAGGRPGLARTLALAPDAVVARDEIARTLLDLLDAGPAARLSAARDLAARATAVGRAMDQGAVATSDPVAAGRAAAGRGSAGRGGSRSVPAAGRSSEIPSTTDPGSTRDTQSVAEEAGEDGLDGAAGAATASASDRRRATLVLIGIWRDVVRDLALLRLGEERRLRDPGLLDDLRAAAGRPEPATGRELATMLRCLDDAAELVEANVRPELILDDLLLTWPAARSGR